MTDDEYDPYKINITDLSIYVCDYCNMNPPCSHCYLSKGSTTINLEWIRWLVNNYSIEKSILIGGEPTICKELPTIVSILKSKKYKDEKGKMQTPNVTVSTNCKWMEWDKRKKMMGPNGISKKEVLERLKDVDSIQISIEGNKKTTDGIRGTGSYENAIQSVKYIKKRGFDVFFRATYSQGNFNDIPFLLDLAKEKQIDLVLFPYKGMDAIPLPEELQEQLYNKLWSLKDKKTSSWVAIPQFFCYADEDDYCPAGKDLINIMPNGLITPCEMSTPPNHFTLGNFENGITKERLERRMRYFLEEIKTTDVECMTCKHHQICRSGCHETREYMNCPMKNQIDINYFLPDMQMNKKQLRTKINQNLAIVNKRKGC